MIYLASAVHDKDAVSGGTLPMGDDGASHAFFRHFIHRWLPRHVLLLISLMSEKNPGLIANPEKE